MGVSTMGSGVLDVTAAENAPIDKKCGAQTIALSGPSEAARASNPKRFSNVF
jgi:hypothetical protein